MAGRQVGVGGGATPDGHSGLTLRDACAAQELYTSVRDDHPSSLTTGKSCDWQIGAIGRERRATRITWPPRPNLEPGQR